MLKKLTPIEGRRKLHAFRGKLNCLFFSLLQKDRSILLEGCLQVISESIVLKAMANIGQLDLFFQAFIDSSLIHVYLQHPTHTKEHCLNSPFVTRSCPYIVFIYSLRCWLLIKGMLENQAEQCQITISSHYLHRCIFKNVTWIKLYL